MPQLEEDLSMKRIFLSVFVILAVASIAFASGNKEQSGAATTTSGNTTHTLAPNAVLAGPTKPDEALENGVKGVPASTLTLSAADKAKLREGHYTAAIVMHVLDSSWSQRQIQGIKSVFDQYGIKVISVTGAQGKPDVQMNNIESVLARKPTVILSIPVDQTAETPAYSAISQAGVKLVLMDMIPTGLKYGTQYSTVVSSSNYGNGSAAADMMAAAFIKLHINNPKVAVMKLNFHHYVTEQRLKGFEDRVHQYYPWIKIETESDFPFNMPKVTEIAAGMLTAHPDLNGVYVVWMTPAMSVVAALREAGISPKKFVITTSDLEADGAMDIASGGYIKGTAAQNSYENGVAEAIAACRAILGYKNPPYIAVPGYAVTRANILEGYKAILGTAAPPQIVKAANGPATGD